MEGANEGHDLKHSKSKDTLLQIGVSTDLCRVRTAKNPALDQALKLWELNMENNNMPIKSDINKTKAESFSTQLNIENGTFSFLLDGY